jgi:hypothetical protein
MLGLGATLIRGGSMAHKRKNRETSVRNTLEVVMGAACAATGVYLVVYISHPIEYPIGVRCFRLALGLFLRVIVRLLRQK